MAKHVDLPDMSPEQLANLIGTAVTKGVVETTGPKKLTAGQYARREAAKNPKPKLTVHLTQNGYPANTDVMSAETITLANAIRLGGRYLNRRVEVIVKKDSEGRHVDLRYPNASADMRIENASYFSSFADLIKKIVAEQGEKLEKRKAKGWVETDEDDDASA